MCHWEQVGRGEGFDQRSPCERVAVLVPSSESLPCLVSTCLLFLFEVASRLRSGVNRVRFVRRGSYIHTYGQCRVQQCHCSAVHSSVMDAANHTAGRDQTCLLTSSFSLLLLKQEEHQGWDLPLLLG